MRTRIIKRMNTKGAALVEYVVLLAMLGVVCILATAVMGERIRCLYETSAIALGSDMTPTCSIGVADAGSGEEEVVVTPPVTPPSGPLGAPLVAFNDINLDATEYGNVSLTVTGLDGGDTVDLVITQGANTVTASGTTAASTYVFSGLDLSAFSRGVATAVVTRGNGVETVDSGPATANITLDMRLEADVPVDGGSFGLEIAMTGDRVFVAAPYENALEGRVYAFDRVTGDQLFIMDPDPTWTASRYGMIMAEGDGFLAITSQEDSGQDFVSVYDMSGTFLFQVDNDANPANNNNYFGREIQIENGILYVGDQLYTWGVGNTGAIHAFDLGNGGAYLWSTNDPSVVGDGSRFDIENGEIIATSWSQDIISFFDASTGAFIKRQNLSNSQAVHIEAVNGYMIYGDNTGVATPIYDLVPTFFPAGSVTYQPPANSALNLYEQAGDYVIINSGGTGAYDIELVDLPSNATVQTLTMPDPLGSFAPQFGAGLAYDNGELAVGAPAHDPAYDGVRTGVVYLMAVDTP